MSAKRKLVVRFNQWYDPAMEARFGAPQIHDWQPSACGVRS